MATISSHILDTISGISAAGIPVQLVRLDSNEKTVLFDIEADNEGRINEQLDIDIDAEYELVFHSARYFSSQGISDAIENTMPTVVLRFSMPDNRKRYHKPIMLSPHSYSVWWSE